MFHFESYHLSFEEQEILSNYVIRIKYKHGHEQKKKTTTKKVNVRSYVLVCACLNGSKFLMVFSP